MLHDFDYVDVSGLPAHMQGAVRRYLNDGIMPGDFLAAALSNDLVQSFSRADDMNRAAMFAWVSWLYNECPGDAWGSPERVSEWAMRRIRAKEAAIAAPATGGA